MNGEEKANNNSTKILLLDGIYSPLLCECR